jgi:hypothetical protein
VLRSWEGTVAVLHWFSLRLVAESERSLRNGEIMSSVKNPTDKKLLSLKNDCRNTYGENAKASRRLIPLRKQQSSQAARAAVAQALQKQTGPVADLDLDAAESLVKTRTIKSKREGFKKRPDTPLMKTILSNKTDLPGLFLPEGGLLSSAYRQIFSGTTPVEELFQKTKSRYVRHQPS